MPTLLQHLGLNQTPIFRHSFVRLLFRALQRQIFKQRSPLALSHPLYKHPCNPTPYAVSLRREKKSISHRASTRNTKSESQKLSLPPLAPTPLRETYPLRFEIMPPSRTFTKLVVIFGDGPPSQCLKNRHPGDVVRPALEKIPVKDEADPHPKPHLLHKPAGSGST